jgi:hypothetical protein
VPNPHVRGATAGSVSAWYSTSAQEFGAAGEMARRVRLGTSLALLTWRTNMAGHQPSAAGAIDQLKELVDEAAQDVARRDERRARIDNTPPPQTRQRLTLGALIAGLPILVLLFLTNIEGLSLADLMTPTPSGPVARQLAQGAMDFAVKEIDSFHDDFSALPDSLSQIGASTDGTWTYTKKTGGQYQLILSMYGESLTFDSSQRVGGLNGRHP